MLGKDFWPLVLFMVVLYLAFWAISPSQKEIDAAYEECVQQRQEELLQAESAWERRDISEDERRALIYAIEIRAEEECR